MNGGTNHPVFPNPLRTKNPENCAETNPQSLLDEKQFQNVLKTKDGEPDSIPLSTNINLKWKKLMLYFPMDLGELTIDGVIDTGALSIAITQTDRPENSISLHNLLSGKDRLQLFRSWSQYDNKRLLKVQSSLNLRLVISSSTKSS